MIQGRPPFENAETNLGTKFIGSESWTQIDALERADVVVMLSGMDIKRYGCVFGELLKSAGGWGQHGVDFLWYEVNPGTHLLLGGY